MLLIAIFGPPLLALLVAFAQQLVYRALVKSGRMQEENAPFFGILLFRGLLVALAVVLIVTMVLKGQNPEIEDDPFWTPEQRESIIEEKYGPGGPEDASAPKIEGEQDEALEQLMDQQGTDEAVSEPTAQSDSKGGQPPSDTPPAKAP